MNATNGRPLRLDHIIRTSKRKKDARSPQQQRDMANGCAQANGYEIVMVHDSGTDESGKTMNRTSINTAMKRIRAGETDGVIVALADRIGRAPIEEAMTTVRAFCTVGKLVLADMGGQPLNLHNGVEESNVVFQLQMARQFWLNTATRFMRSQADAIKAGKFVGPTPLGYVRRNGRLFEHPKWGPVIRRAYRIAATEGIHAVIAYLDAQAIPGRNGTRVWTTDSVRKLLGSRAYLGESRTGDLHNDSAHEPLTNLADWLAAQTAPRKRRANLVYPLSGIARCVTCGGPLAGQLQTTPTGYAYRRYRCGKACRGGSSISADKLEAYIRDHMRSVLLDDDGLATRFRPAGVDEAHDELEQTKAERLAHAMKVSPSHPTYQPVLEQWDRRVEEAEAAYRKLASQAAHAELLPAADQLDDPEQFVRGLRLGVVHRAYVRPGRGPIGLRVTLTALVGGDELAWPLSA